ncbi:MEGF10_11 [Mytilus coruscus]|uniref:MEGF10_11 n=1 Tax=Mytilus coruscus TaxID=42192 RepID=A0A6J8CWU9_MYTCO|nr:MEGF10_11 [Mytilus coruscus]
MDSKQNVIMINIFLLCFLCFGNILCNYVCNNQPECNYNAGNGVCDSSCNNLNCSYDSGDCVTNNNPWSKCTEAARCQSSFYNDTCDSSCNNELCLYDQLKCKPSFTTDCFAACLNEWGNGNCSSSCNNVECGYDGNDCKVVGSTVSGTMLVYAKSDMPRPSDTARFIGFSLSLATRTIVSMKLSVNYNGTVPEIESLGDPGLRVLYEVQNTPNCNTDIHTVCWNSMNQLAMYSAAFSKVLNNFVHSVGVNVTITKVLACQDGFYGEDCNLPCNINCKSGCYLFDGSCIGGCLGNFNGEMCQFLCSSNCRLGCFSGSTCISGECHAGYTGAECTTECSSGTHGSNCESNCSLGCLDGNCNVLDGSCNCKSGYNGTQCEIECPDGTYGSYCNGTCGNCLYGASCDKMNGSCLNGCNAGYYGTMCTYVCPDGTHGSGCSMNCTNCVNNTCLPTTGNCRAGCVTGWTGEDCSTAITTIIYTTNTTTQITVAIGGVLAALFGCGIILFFFVWRRGKKDNYQSHLDTQIIIGEGKKAHHSDTESQQSTSDASGINEAINETGNEEITEIGL